jgi:hypothetical protein
MNMILTIIKGKAHHSDPRHPYSGMTLRISDGTTTQDIPIHRNRTDHTNQDMKFFLTIVKDDRPRPFVDFSDDDLDGTLSVSLPVRTGYDPRFCLIRLSMTPADFIRTATEKMNEFYAAHYVKLEKLPLKGEPLLSAALTERGFFVRSLSSPKNEDTSLHMSLGHRNATSLSRIPTYHGFLRYDLPENELFEGSGYGWHRLFGLDGVIIGDNPATSFFSEAGLQLFRGMLLKKLLPKC